MTRHELRKEGLMILFKMDFYGEEFDIESLNEYGVEYAESVEFAHLFIDHEEEINDMIKSKLVNYTLTRLNIVDRVIIRLATGELMFTESPIGIVINEALKLTEELSDLGDKKQVKFNNSILDTIAKAVRA